MRACSGGCFLCIFLGMALLTAARIQGAHYSVFIIFIPLFAIVSPGAPHDNETDRPSPP
jgi:hypothetical protein